jgi:hypothetical protein
VAVNKPENDDPSIIERIELATNAAWANKRQPEAETLAQRFALRRFLDFLGEALREATVF